MRGRLEVTLGVVVTGAAIIGLSTVIRPDPSKLTSMVMIPRTPSSAELREEGRLRPEPPLGPKVAADFAAAVAGGDLEAMERLHTPGMPLDGMLPVAAESGAHAVVRWLLDHGANVHEDEGSVDAPVLLADDHPEVVALLLERGATEPSLSAAAQAGASNAVFRLLPPRAVVPPTDVSLYAAVSSTRAAPEKKKLIVERLLGAGADPNRDGNGDDSLAGSARACNAPSGESAAADECVAIIKLLVKHGARSRGDAIVAALAHEDPLQDQVLDAVLTARLERGATAVALALTWQPSPRAIKRLVAKGVDWSWHDGEEDAALPLLAAVQQANRDYVRALLDAGAPADAHFKDGTCALGLAIDGSADSPRGEYARIVELLIARGANVNRRLPDGRTPLFAAAESGDLRVVTALLDRGARVNDLVIESSALDAAEDHGHLAASRVLHARGARRGRQNGGFRSGDSSP
jgi:uncharacterized protein